MTPPTTPAAVRASDAMAAALADRFGEVLRGGDGGGAEQLIDEALGVGLAPAEVQSLVIAPAMVRIGEMWESRLIGVADEHLATSISQRVLIQLFATMSGQRRPKVRATAKVILAAVQGQHHVLGLRMVADVLEGAGFEVIYLGADLPVDSLRAVVQKHQPAIVGLTFGISADVAALAESLWVISEVSPLTRIMLGGRAVPPTLADAGYASVARSMDVLPVVERLLAEPPQRPPAIVDALRSGSSTIGPSGHPGETDAAAERWAKASEDAVEVAREHVRRAETYRDLAFRDELTDLPNRRAFEDALASLTGSTTGGAVLMIDVDKFKSVNDEHGHAAGDRLLRAIAVGINASVRPGDTPARVGGDEFAVLLPAATPALASEIGDRIRSTLRKDPAVPVSVSVGVSILSGDARSAMLAADIALYQAKSAGRDCVVTAPAQPVDVTQGVS